ncbi:antibiotic biosynthesis protein [Devosia pacifica]|uniref:Antibiotic biosynthesis protein n=1 Tax=Devosia pacifica TaxID=1335967 RepID=A0A918S5S7_9HYPH|nr:class I SAM-dependent methyltransferase [Devosia pacifica]GHA22977.1 antibiotic biosynthesis protein [Devosia pacifica]
MSAGLYDDAELYDLVAPPDADMEAFYVNAAGGPSRRVLELACGSGRITVPLATSGASVTGVDLSETMLARARDLLATRGVSAKLVTLDMRSFQLDEKFDVIVLAANSLLHLHTHEEFADAFSAIRRHLAPGGVFAFDVFVPCATMLSRAPGDRHRLACFEHPRLGAVTVEETIDYDPTTQISAIDWYWSTPANGVFRHTPLTLRQIYPQELPLLLRLGGLELANRFGGFSGEPFSRHSRRQVCTAIAA